MTVTINGATGIAGVNGTAVIPAVQGNDTNTGVFYGTDIVAISTGGTERVRVNASGNVGIGTTANYRLAVVGGATQLSGSTDAAAGLRVQTASGVATLTGVNSDNNAFNPIAFYTSGTEGLRIATAGQIGIGGANYGTSGQVLTSGGASAAPSWAAVSATGQLLRAPQIIITGTTYTTPANCTAVYVEAVGAGGGSGGAINSSFGGAGGGGGGGYAAKYFTVTASTPYTYAIGAGGTAGASTPTAGGTGGSTTFTVSATTITGSGGGGGATGISASSTLRSGGVGGTGTNGDLNLSGSSGTEGMGSVGATVSSQFAKGGGGGASGFGNGGGFNRVNSDGAGAAGNFGGGAGGACVNGTADRAGGVGGTGWIRIWEYS